ncbi:MAG: DeoR/GlpR transcriptional regulator [Clostridia bacterium]|nr:DeoR/GlpR transcriptional regulator [Clostridia bacterium]
MKTTRLEDMERYIRERGTVSMNELSERFDISVTTLRRDLAVLRSKGAIEKVYGGVTAMPGEQEPYFRSFSDRCHVDEEKKRRVARAAAALVRRGDAVFLDSGTTTLHMAEPLSQIGDVTVVTYSLAAVQALVPYPGVSVIVLPGLFQRKTDSVTGIEAVAQLKKFNIQKVFMAATGAVGSGVTNSFSPEYEVKCAAMETDSEKVLLITGAKFGAGGLMKYAEFSDFDYIVTDTDPPAPYADTIKKSGARLVIAPAR